MRGKGERLKVRGERLKEREYLGKYAEGSTIIRLSFVALPLEVEDIAVEGLVLGLLLEGCLVLHYLAWIFHAGTGGCADRLKLLLMRHFILRIRSNAFSWNGGVLAVGTLAVVVASAVLFRDFARKVMDWVFVNNLCHMCSAIEPNRPPRRAVRPLRC